MAIALLHAHAGGDALAFVVAHQLKLQPQLNFIFDEKGGASTSDESGRTPVFGATRPSCPLHAADDSIFLACS